MITKIFAWFLLFLSCEEATYEFTELECRATGIRANTSIQTVKDLYVFGRPVPIEEDLIIEGYVVSSDQAGNIYKTLSIQDRPENPTVGIAISIDASNLYTKFELGRKVFINLKGLAIGNYFGRVQLGQLHQGELTGISLFDYQNHLIRSCELSELTPLELPINGLGKEYLDMFITVRGVQLKASELGNSFGDPVTNQSVDRNFSGFDSECSKLGSITVRTSGFADFKNYMIPQGRGALQGVLQNYYSDLQLVLRDDRDVQFTEEYCEEQAWTPTIALSDLTELYQGEVFEFGVDSTLIVEGYVISSDQEGNFQDRIVIQDTVENPTIGIQLLIEGEELFERFPMGAKVLVRLNGLYMNKQRNILSIGIHDRDKIAGIPLESSDQHILNSQEVYEIVPKLSEFDMAAQEQGTGILVRFEEVQLDSVELGRAFAFFSGDDDGYRKLVQCDAFQTLRVFTEGTASFANHLFPKGKGSIIGVLGAVLELRSKEDLFFELPYEFCEQKIPAILISEVADPYNSVGARFVELYNAGDFPLRLQNWKLEKFLNGSSKVSGSGVDLSELVIEPQSYVIIGNTDFEAVFGIPPTLMSTYISGNGDDVYRLVDSSGKTIDIFGVIGEDGNGTNWEYSDGGAVRKTSVKIPSEMFKSEEWIISSKSNNFLINYPNTPKYAPKDYAVFSE